MSNKVTPLINPIALQGGTFYTFNSAAEDLTLSFNNNNNDKKFRFSKFALLDIPDITNEPFKNTLKLKAIPGAYNSVTSNRTNDWNNHFAESFQNYCLNLETMAISTDNYDPSLNRTVSERVFFKWMKEIGALRFQQDFPDEIESPRYTEETDSTNYNRVVQYLGDIDYINNINSSRNSYSEVYFHVPTEVGGFDKIFFKTVEDNNYRPNMTFDKNNQGLNNEFLWGREYDDVHPAGLDIHAFYDNDTGLGDLVGNISEIELYAHSDESENYVLPDDYFKDEWWYFQTTQKNAYYTEPDEFTDSGNYDLAIFDPRGQGDGVDKNLASTKFRRSRLDGISIDWDPKSYKGINPDINYLIDVARDPSAKDFNFNAILVYYDIFRDISNDELLEREIVEDGVLTLDTIDTKEYEEILATNLFGVLFLDNVENSLSLGGGYIPRYKKCRPNEITKLNGNSYGFKLNLKLDISPVTSGVEVETEISNSNTLSMDIYADALSVFRGVTESVLDLSHSNLNYDKRLREVEESKNISKINRIDTIDDRLREVEKITNSPLTQSSASEILKLIDRNYKSLRDILNGNTDINLTLDTSSIILGNGLESKKDKNGNRVISSIDSYYNYPDKIKVSVNEDFTLNQNYYKYESLLRPGRNYLRLEETSNFTPSRDIKIYLSDKTTRWKKGQIYKIHMASEYIMRNSNGNFNLYIYTDYNNTLKKSSNFSKEIIKLNISDFEKHGNNPSLEIHCIDPEKLEFLVDIN